MMFVRYESFRQYIRYYPINTIVLFLIIAAHIGFAIWSMASGIPVDDLKIVFGAFVIFDKAGIVPEYWRYISSIFLHAGFGHLLSNAFAIFVFAPPLERALGSFRYSVLFLFSGITGNILYMLAPRNPDILYYAVGASGAVYGVFGAYIFIMLFYRQTMDAASRSTMISLLVIGVIYSIVVPQVNFMAHLGGFIGGFLLAFAYAKLLPGRGR